MSVSLPYREDVNQWSVEQLAAWLQQREMPDIADIYLRRGIDGHKMITLPEGEHIATLSSLPLRERLDLLNIIKKIKSHSLSATQKCQTQRTVQINNRKPPLQSSLPTNNLRYVSPHHSLPEHLSLADIESSDLSLPYIDETVNEDYLVPLSTGLGTLPLDPPAPVKMKKSRCPSPPLTLQKPRERNKIQDLELPQPPGNHKTAHITPYIECLKKFNTLAASESEESRHQDMKTEATENKEDFNAYEVIQEDGAENSETRAGVESQELDSKPPDLPHRNLSSQSPSTAPVVPIRTHASKNRQPVRNNRFVNLPSEAPLQREGLTASLLQPTTCTPKPFIPAHPPRPTPPGGLHKPHNYKLAKSPLTNATRYPLPDLGSRSALGSPSLSTAPEVLKLEGSKSVPLNNLYRSLLDKEYFHPVARNVVGEMLTEDSMFLVRPSMHSQHLLTLSVSNKGKIFNFVIRSRNDTKFALGTEKPGETAFSSVEEMIQFHKREPIKVEDGSLVYLKRSPTNDLFGPARKEMTSTENCFSFRIVPKI